jgi:hypothetical protein
MSTVHKPPPIQPVEPVAPVAVETLDPLPRLRLTLPTDNGALTVQTEGLTETVALEIPWGVIIDQILSRLPKTKSGGSGCWTSKVTNPDGSTVETKICPAP